MSNSVRPHRWQATRLHCPWGIPGKNTGVGCHFLLQCMKVKSESEVTQSCLTLRDPMDCSPPGSSIPVHGIFQASTGVGCHCLFWQASLQGVNELLGSYLAKRSPEAFCTKFPGWGLTLYFREVSESQMSTQVKICE